MHVARRIEDGKNKFLKVSVDLAGGDCNNNPHCIVERQFSKILIRQSPSVFKKDDTSSNAVRIAVSKNTLTEELRRVVSKDNLQS